MESIYVVFLTEEGREPSRLALQEIGKHWIKTPGVEHEMIHGKRLNDTDFFLSVLERVNVGEIVVSFGDSYLSTKKPELIQGMASYVRYHPKTEKTTWQLACEFIRNQGPIQAAWQPVKYGQ